VGEILLAHTLAVDLDDIPGRDERVQLSALSVHGHAALFDQIVSGAARCDAGAGEVAIETHDGIVV
jgi:hypothetical protein